MPTWPVHAQTVWCHMQSSISSERLVALLLLSLSNRRPSNPFQSCLDQQRIHRHLWLRCCLVHPAHHPNLLLAPLGGELTPRGTGIPRVPGGAVANLVSFIQMQVAEAVKKASIPAPPTHSTPASEPPFVGRGYRSVHVTYRTHIALQHWCIDSHSPLGIGLYCVSPYVYYIMNNCTISHCCRSVDSLGTLPPTPR